MLKGDVKKMIAVNIAVIFFIGLDRLLKVFAFNSQGREVNLFGEILKFSYKNNYYIAFSLPFSGIWLSAVIFLITLLLIFYLLKAYRNSQWGITIYLFALAMGAASNLFDRLKYGYVIDYLDLKYFTVFNLADVMITISVFLLLLNISKKEDG